MKNTTTSGFTLVEMIVAVALFAIVMLVCVGALLSLVAANRKVHALQSVMNSLNVTLDGMVRDVRMGSAYDGSANCLSGYDTSRPKDCTGGGTQFSYIPYCQNGVCPPATTYKFDSDATDCGQSGSAVGCIMRSKNGGAFAPVTSPDITIDKMLVYVVGSSRGCAVTPCDLTQPKVVIVIKGTALAGNAAAKSQFHIQVTAVQRLLDL